MRVVFDTNILVSFAIRPSPSFELIFDHVAAHGISLVSEETVAELFDVPSRDKFRRYISLSAAIDYAEWYMGISELVAVTESVVACRDPKDDKFLALASAGRADCIVAGDSDLLEMTAFRNIPICRPAYFVHLLAG
jgi:putative PIN family toxin of toxin-antitoxin system